VTPPPAAPLIVATKLVVPEIRPETVARARVMRLLAASAGCRLTVVAAPAGYGKTTALVEWLASAGGQSAWVSVDVRDNDPRRFWAHLLAAVDRVVPAAVEPARRALVGGSDLLDTVVDLTANALAEHADGGLVLALDDYHLVEERSCHELLMALVDCAPRTVRFVVSGRTKPPLRLARRRAAGTLAEIGAEELGFREGESERLLNESFALGLEPGGVEAIHDRVRGWPAGLSLIASSLRDGTNPGDVVHAISAPSGKLAQYLIEEVLDAMDPKLRDFLRRTSILGRLNASLCEAVLDDPSARDLLGEVRRSHLFVTVLEGDPAEDGEWLVYHQLFRELLERELRERSPELVPALHLRASDWFAASGAPDEAIGHAIAAGDGARAAELLHDHQRVFLVERRYVTVRQMIAQLPPERGAFAGFCDALDTLCFAMEGVDLRLVSQRLDALESMRSSPGVAQIADQMRVSPYYGDVGRAVEAGWALWERYADQPEMRSWMAGQFGLVLWFAGDRAAARQILEPGLAEMIGAGRLWALSALALTTADDDDSELSERYAREAVEWAEAGGGESALESHIAYAALGDALRLRGALDEARERLEHAARLTGKLPSSLYHAHTLISQAQLALAARDRRRARTRAAAARRIVEQYPDVGAIAERLAAVEAALERPAGGVLLGSQPTRAELRLLALLPTDLTLKQIADRLYLSTNTVASHRKRLYRRLGAKTRAEAVAAARERSLL
jgi:LuxR family maltose regulon positive regulatory protein